jgi:hypothetical protein
MAESPKHNTGHNDSPHNQCTDWSSLQMRTIPLGTSIHAAQTSVRALIMNSRRIKSDFGRSLTETVQRLTLRITSHFEPNVPSTPGGIETCGLSCPAPTRIGHERVEHVSVAYRV